MSENTRTCSLCCSTPQVAVNSSQVTNQLLNLTTYAYVSTIQSTTPGYVYKYKSQTERIQALMGKISITPS